MNYYKDQGEVQVLSIGKYYGNNLSNVNRALAEIITCKGELSEDKWVGLGELIRVPWRVGYAFVKNMEEYPKTYNVYEVSIENLQEETIKSAIIADIKRMEGESEAKEHAYIRFNPWEDL